MSAVDCAREPEVVAAVLARRWPDGCSEDLRAHAGSCAMCGEVLLIASALHADHSTMGDIEVPAPGQVWWRAAVRARAEAAHAAARPMNWLQGVVGASVAGLGFTLVSRAWPFIHRAVTDVAPMLIEPLQRQLPLVLVVGVVLVVAPLAFYVAIVRD